MLRVLTLIAGQEVELAPAAIEAARDAVAGFARVVERVDWLAPGVACDIAFAADAASSTIMAAVRAALGAAPIDAAVLPADGRRKRLLVADMDSTIVVGETLDELAAEAGIKDRVAAITARAMNGEIDFKAALRERVALLAGLPVDALQRTYERIRLMPGARPLVRTMRAHGAHTLLVSGGFRFFTGRIREAAGFDEDRANDLLVEGSVLTGRVAEPILDRDAKLSALRDAAVALGVPLAAALAVGDGANDLAMIKAAGLGVAFRAKPVVAAEAQVRIDHADLTALLYLQGYRRSDFVE